jgi:hypothetical protein
VFQVDDYVSLAPVPAPVEAEPSVFPG